MFTIYNNTKHDELDSFSVKPGKWLALAEEG
jgi:hypothetical protein